MFKENSPMQDIKYALAFIFGILYTTCWHLLISHWPGGDVVWADDEMWLILPLVGVVVGSGLLLFRITTFFIDHWE